MKQTFISDWWKVFKFTIRQGTISKKFRAVTILLAVVMFALAVIINIAMAYSEKNESDIYEIEKCYFVNNSDLDTINPEGLTVLYPENYPDISFETRTESVEKLAKEVVSETKADDSEEVEYTKDVILEVVREEEAYLVKVYIPNNSEVTEEEAEYLGEDFAVVVQQGKMISVDVPVENQVMALSQVNVEYIEAGEEAEDEMGRIIKVAVSMIIIMVLFFMLLIYGQSMGTIVSIEKSSKLVEYLLTLVGPQGLVFGKITAMSVIAIGQFVLWIGSFVAGFIAGDAIATEFVYSQYTNDILEAIESIRKMESGALAFTPEATIMAVLAICMTVLFYFMIAGLTAAFVSKPDELQSSYAIYQVFMMIGFFGGYVAPAMGNEQFTTIMRWIPFSSAFMLPGDIISGNITLLEGAGYMAVLGISVAIVVYLTGKVYKNQLFNRGKDGKIVAFVKKVFVR